MSDRSQPSGRSARFPAAAPAETLCRPLKGDQGFGRSDTNSAGSKDPASEGVLRTGDGHLRRTQHIFAHYVTGTHDADDSAIEFR